MSPSLETDASTEEYGGTLGRLDSKKVHLEDAPIEAEPAIILTEDVAPIHYRLYKRRWSGLVALFLLNIVSGVSWPWFGPITIPVSQRFGFSLNQVNWLGNAVSLVFLPMSFAIPPLCRRFGIRTICLGAAVCLLLAAWLRYAGTASGLSSRSAYALMLIAQMLVGVAQPIYQVLGPKFSELWFDLRFRTTATMIIAISNPLGSALGQLFAPLVSDPKGSILLLAIISTVIPPLALLIESRPPTPPTFAASTPSPPMLSTIRALFGKQRRDEPALEMRDRLDFGILVFVFSVAVAAVSAFSILTNEIMEPYGYTNVLAGLMGAALLLAGIIAAVISAPILDRLLTHHLRLTFRVVYPIMAIGWLSLVFTVRRDDAAGIFVSVVIVGIAALILLPVGLEVGCEVTRNPETSSAALWFGGNAGTLILVPIESALKASPNASAPLNFRRGLIFNATMVIVAAVAVFGVRARQTRRELDEEKAKEARAIHEMLDRPTP